MKQIFVSFVIQEGQGTAIEITVPTIDITIKVIPALKTDPKPKKMSKKLGTITTSNTTRRTMNQNSGS